MTENCVAKCPTGTYDSETAVCQECAVFDSSRPVLKGDECVSCFEATPTRPVWDKDMATCRPCSASKDSGSFWDLDAQACRATCDESYDIRRVCQTCQALDPTKPAWLNGVCTTCSRGDETRPKWNNETKTCEPCPVTSPIWLKELQMCGAECREKNMYVSGTCVEAIAENCRGDKVFTGKECIECDSEKGLTYIDGACVCDPTKYLAAAADGSCTACSDPLLKYDEAIGQCYCANGANLTKVNNVLHCDDPCESGVFNYTLPQICMASCPSGMVLHAETGHVRCEKCDGYVYYDAVTGMTSCTDYMGCVKLGMSPRIVYEDQGSLAVCTEGAVHTEYLVDGESLENVQGMALGTFDETRFYFVLHHGKVQVSKQGFNGEAIRVFTPEDVVSIG